MERRLPVILCLMALLCVGVMPAHAATVPATAPAQHSLPVAAVSPENGATTVRPDAALVIRFDTQARVWPRVREQLRDGRYGLRLAGGGRVLYLLANGYPWPVVGRAETGRQSLPKASVPRGVAVLTTARFDLASATLIAAPPTLGRYTTYEIALLLKGALRQAMRHDAGRGAVDRQPLENEPAAGYAWSFTTGSALGEPTQVALMVADAAPAVTDEAALVLSARDDYGDPAYGAAVAASLAATGTGPLDSSARVAPVSATLTPAAAGELQLHVTDHRPEGVQVTVATSGPYDAAHDTHSLTADLTFRAGPPSSLSLTASPDTLVADGHAQATLAGRVADIYGNPVADGIPVTFLVSGGGSVAPNPALTAGGAFSATYTAGTTPGSVTVKAMAAVASAEVSYALTAPIPPGSRIVLNAPAAAAGGSYTVSGKLLAPGGAPVAGAALTLTATGGTATPGTVVTGTAGNFAASFTPSAAGGSVAVSGAGTVLAAVGIDPLIYGNQPWTDTGIAVAAGQTVTVVATGPWAGGLLARVGMAGLDVPVGTSYTFVADTVGVLYLGPGANLTSGDVDATVTVGGLDGIVPTLDLTAMPTTLTADGTSTATVSGALFAGPVPVVGAPVNLALVGPGKLSAVTVTTGADGRFTATYTAGGTAGTAQVTATYGVLSQSVSIALAAPPSGYGTGAEGALVVPTGSSINLGGVHDYTSVDVAGVVHVSGPSLVLNVQGDASITGMIDGSGAVSPGSASVAATSTGQPGTQNNGQWIPCFGVIWGGSGGGGGGAGGYLSGTPGQNGGQSQLYNWNSCTNSYLSSVPGSPGGQGGTAAFSASNPLATLVSGAPGGAGGSGGNCGGGVAYSAPGSGGAYVAINAASIEVTGRIFATGTAGLPGSGCVNGPSSGGGGGGGGGDVLLRAATVTLTGSQIVTAGGPGGLSGGASNNWGSGGAGGAGGSGVVVVDANTLSGTPPSGSVVLTPLR